MSAVSHLRAITLLPGAVVVVVPGVILYSEGSIRFVWSMDSTSGIILWALGVISIAIGLLLMVKTNLLFAGIGKGTLAPWEPPKKLIVEGIYRQVRNPMLSGVFFILCGESLIFGSKGVFIWFLLFLFANLIYLPLFEEPALEKRFGNDYVQYKKNVPRWIPRLTPWEPD